MRGARRAGPTCLSVRLGWMLIACLLASSRTSAAETERARGAGALFAGPVGEDLARAKAAWDKAGPVFTPSPRLLVRGTPTPLALPEVATDGSSSACATLLIIGGASTVFSLSFGQGPFESRPDLPLESSLGFLELARCGARKQPLAQAWIETLSPHAVVSFLVAIGDAPAESSLALLEHRQPGPIAPAPLLGPRPLMAPLSERLAAKKRAHARDLAQALSDGLLSVDDAGVAHRAFSLAAGCHAFEVLDASSTAGLADVDARVLDADGRTLAVDGSTAPDARVSLCLGEADKVTLDVRGAAAQSALAWIHASWTLPDGVPPEWGSRARGRLAETLHEGRWPALINRPIASSLGVQGTTTVAVSVLPGACYVLAVAALDRSPERLGLAAQAGGRMSQARARPSQHSASVAICASVPLLSVEVQSLGAGASWILGVWEIGRARP